MAKTKTFSTLDIYLASFLSLHDQDVILELQNGKVVFTFESTDSLYRLNERFQLQRGNTSLGLHDCNQDPSGQDAHKKREHERTRKR